MNFSAIEERKVTHGLGPRSTNNDRIATLAHMVQNSFWSHAEPGSRFTPPAHFEIMTLNFQTFTIKYFAILLITIKGVESDSFNTFYFPLKEEGLVFGIFFQGYRVHENHIILIWIISHSEIEMTSVPGFQPLLIVVETSMDLTGDHPPLARVNKQDKAHENQVKGHQESKPWSLG